MINFLRGIIIHKGNNEVILDVNGVGYLVYVSKKMFGSLPELNQEVRIITYFDVRENAMNLYGFFDEREREIFKMLITVSGISTKTAHTILSHSGFEDIIGLITGRDTFSRIKIPGVGPRKIELISIALKDKVFKISVQDEGGLQKVVTASGKEEQSRLEALNAMMNLGYSRAEAEKLIREVLKQNPGIAPDTEEIIRKAFELI